VGKKKPKKQQAAKTRSDADLIQAAERAAARAKWKDALAAYKELNKRHPGQYEAPIVQVQIQRYQAFLESGMFESAEQLLDALRGQLPPAQLKAFELQRAESLQDQDTIAKLSWQTLEEQQAAGQALDAALLDSLIFCDTTPTPTLATHPEVITLLAVRTGLQGICQNQPEALATAMASISRQSSLAQWKLLLRALDAWYSGQDEILDKCFNKLTDLRGKLKHIVAGIQLLRQSQFPITAETLATTLALHANETDDADALTLAADLLQTDCHLDANQYVDAFKFARSTFNFSQPESCIARSVLDRFVTTFKSGNHSEYQQHLSRWLTNKGIRPATSFPFLQAQFAAWNLPCNCIDCVGTCGKQYLRTLAARGASDPVLARAHLHLAEAFLKEVRDEDMEDDDDDLKSHLNTSIDLLRKAMRLDPQYTEAGLLLFEAHQLAKAPSAANKLLDQLAATHTDNPKILQLAGRRCIERGTLVRGLKQLEQALTLDPHLQGLKLDFLQASLQKAHADFQKGQITKGRACFANMRIHLQEKTHDCDYWFDARLMRLRWLELERSHSDAPAEINALSNTVEKDWQGRELMHQALTYFFIEQFGSSQRQVETHESKKAFFIKTAPLLQMLPEQVHQLFIILKEGNRLAKKQLDWGAYLTLFLDSYRKHYQPARLEGILAILWEAVPASITPRELIETCKLWSKADRHHPQLKMLLLWAKYSQKKTVDQNDLDELDQALDTARQRNDSFALNKGEPLRQTFIAILERPPPGRHHFADDDEDDDDDDDDDDDGDGDDDGVTYIDEDDIERDDRDDSQPEFDFDRGAFGSEALYNESPFDVMNSIFTRWKGYNNKERKEFEQEMRQVIGKKMTDEMIRALNKAARG